MPHAKACNSAFRQTLRGKPPGVTRRVALSRVPLTIPQPPFGVCERISVPQDGVRTFLPPSHLAMTKPAITRPARQSNYTSMIRQLCEEVMRHVSPQVLDPRLQQLVLGHAPLERANSRKAPMPKHPRAPRSPCPFQRMVVQNWT